jgi:hypothetical protein
LDVEGPELGKEPHPVMEKDPTREAIATRSDLDAFFIKGLGKFEFRHAAALHQDSLKESDPACLEFHFLMPDKA